MGLAAFSSCKEFRRWLREDHDTASELIVHCYNVASKHEGIRPEALEEALCFGWIDGGRPAIDEESFSNRFAPRSREHHPL